MKRLGRSLLDGPTWERVHARPTSGELVLVVYDSGRLSPSAPALRLRLKQSEHRVEQVEIDTRPGVRWAAPRSVGGAVPQVRLWQTLGAAVGARAGARGGGGGPAPHGR